MDPTTATPIAGLDETLDVTLDAAGARLAIERFEARHPLPTSIRPPFLAALATAACNAAAAC